MKKIVVILTLFAAFTLTTSVGAVCAMPAPWPAHACHSAAYIEKAEALNRCEFELTLDSPESASFRARYTLKNSSSERTVVSVKQPVKYASKGALTVGGRNVIPTVRHTYDRYGFGIYDIEDEVGAISDEFIDAYYYSPDKPIFKRTYRVTELDAPTATVCFTFEKNNDTKFVFCNSFTTEEKRSKLDCYVTAYKNAELVVYEIGNNIEPEITFFKQWDYDPIYGEAETVGVEELTFRQFVASFNNGDVSEVDYYNAVVNSLDGVDRCFYDYEFDLYERESLIKWLCLDIPLEAGEQTYLEFADVLEPTWLMDNEVTYSINLFRPFPTALEITVISPHDFTLLGVDKTNDGTFLLSEYNNNFSVNVDYSDGKLSSSIIEFIIGFLGRIIAIPIAIVIAKVIVKSIAKREKIKN